MIGSGQSLCRRLRIRDNPMSLWFQSQGSRAAVRGAAAMMGSPRMCASAAALRAAARRLREKQDLSCATRKGRYVMPIVRSIEVIAQSSQGFDEACKEAVREASKTLRGIRSFWIKNAECIVEGDRITSYRVNGKISFLVEDERR
jgi:flavin-binding protein dodecin